VSDVDVGSTIKQLRQAAGITQAALADGLVSAAYISLIESGRRVPSGELLDALLERLGAGRGQDAQDRDLLLKVVAATEVGDIASASALVAADPDASATPLRRLARALVDQRTRFYQRAQEEFLELADIFEHGTEEHLRAVRGACACARYTGWLERAISTAEHALRLPTPRSNPVLDDLRVTIRGSTATLLALRGDYAASLAMCRGTIEQATTPWARASALWVQSMTYESQGEDELAVMSAREALAHARAGNLPIAQAEIANAAAWLELRLGGFDAQEMRKSLADAEDVLQRAGAIDSVAAVRATLAELRARTESIFVALEDFEAAIAMMSPNQHVMRAHNLCIMGALLRDAGDAETAVAMLNRALAELQNTENWAETSRAWRELSVAYEQLGLVEPALECMKRAAQLVGLRPISTTSQTVESTAPTG